MSWRNMKREKPVTQPTIKAIQRFVAKHHNVEVSDLVGPRRNNVIVRPRQIAYFLCKDMTNHSYPEIGRAFGGRDHTTVIDGKRKVEARNDPDDQAFIAWAKSANGRAAMQERKPVITEWWPAYTHTTTFRLRA